MSSSSDIEKLFDHFGGDAGAYQEIGRENEARHARTRWPLLVTLDLSQPQIPAVTPAGSAPDRQPVDGSGVDAREPAQCVDAKQNDAAASGRTKTPLFARPHRRDIPPVAPAQAAQSAHAAISSGASRFAPAQDLTQADARREAGTVDTERSEAPATAVPAVGAVPVAPPVVPMAHATVPPVPLATPVPPAARAFAPPVAPPASSPLPASTSASQPPIAPIPPRVPSPASSAQTPPASILGKLFAPADLASATSAGSPAFQHAATPAAPAPLSAIFDRLRGEAAVPPAAAPSPAPHSWLINGPRRS